MNLLIDVGEEKYDPYTQFCPSNKIQSKINPNLRSPIYDKCNGEKYDPDCEKCDSKGKYIIKNRTTRGSLLLHRKTVSKTIRSLIKPSMIAPG